MWVWRDPTLKSMVDGPATATVVLGYVNGLSGATRDIAVEDLVRGRVDYAARGVAPAAVSKMDQVLQALYAEVAQTAATGALAPLAGWPAAGVPAGLLAGTHVPSPAERTRVGFALTPGEDVSPVTGLPPPFHSRIGALNYETRIRTFVEAEIDDEWDSMVRGKGVAEHADPAKLIPMTRLQEVGNAAKDEVDAVFGSYARRPPFVPGVNLVDEFVRQQSQISAMTPSERHDVAVFRVQKILRSEPTVRTINREHNALPDRDTLSTGELESEKTILTRISGDLASAHETRLLEIHRNWPGRSGGGVVALQRFREPTAAGLRRQYWSAFETMIHEYIHGLGHPAYELHARTPGGVRSDKYQTLIEGMTSVLTEVVWANVRTHIGSPALRTKVEGPAFAALPLVPAVVPDIVTEERYPSYEQAIEVVSVVGIRNVYAAYFLGRVELIRETP
jgi:hypothetical protein